MLQMITCGWYSDDHFNWRNGEYHENEWDSDDQFLNDMFSSDWGGDDHSRVWHGRDIPRENVVITNVKNEMLMISSLSLYLSLTLSLSLFLCFFLSGLLARAYKDLKR